MQSTVSMIAAPPWMLADLWPKVGGLLLKGILSNGETDPEFVAGDLKDCADRIVDGRNQLWVVLQDTPHRFVATFCTSILIEPGGSSVVHIHTLAGDAMSKWGHLLAPTIDAFARAEGCRAVQYEGREGWSRVLPAVAMGTTGDGVPAFERVLQ